MQSDMHFYGTYVLSRAAGIPREDAHTIAYASQFVDDSTEKKQRSSSRWGIAGRDRNCASRDPMRAEQSDET